MLKVKRLKIPEDEVDASNSPPNSARSVPGSEPDVFSSFIGKVYASHDGSSSNIEFESGNRTGYVLLDWLILSSSISAGAVVHHGL